MRVALVMNEAAGSAQSAGELARAGAEARGWDVHLFGQESGAAKARALAEQGYELVVAGGGDGTIRAAVQGLAGASRQPLFGVLPLGTGNDLARALGMPLEVEAALDALARGASEGRSIAMDVLRLEHGDTTSVCANSVNGGIAPLIREQMSSELKARLGPLAFVWGALSSLTQLTRWPVRYRVDGGPVRDASFVAFVIANGSSVGGGVQVAPVARLDDGQLDLVVVHADASIAELTVAAIQAKFGDLFKSDCVEHVAGARIELIEQPPELGFTADGEAIEGPLRAVSIVRGALRAITGPRDPAVASTSGVEAGAGSVG